MNRLTRIILEYIIAVLVIALLLISITSVVAVKFYGEDLKVFVIREVNDRLDAKVNVGESEVRVFQRFPNTSIVLKDITVWSSHNFSTQLFNGRGADTLMVAQNVFVDFNPFSLILKKRKIRRLEVRDGTLHLYTDRTGEINYRFLANRSPKEKTDQQLHINELKISNFNVFLDNQAKDIRASGTLEQLSLNGKFSRRNTQIRTQLSGELEEISNKGIPYASDRTIRLKMNMDVTDSIYSIRAGQLQIDRITADMDGTFLSMPGKGVEMDLYASARNLNIHEILDLLPSETASSLKGLRGNGILQLYTRVTGIVTPKQAPGIEADFQTSHANLQWDRFPFSVKNLNLTGSFSNGGAFNPLTTSLRLESFSADIGRDHISGSGSLINFYDPEFSLVLKGEIHPEQWISWYEHIPVSEASGTIKSDISVSGAYNREKTSGGRFSAFDLSGDILLEEVMCRIAPEGTPFTGINGSVGIENDLWEPSIQGRFGESDFSIQGTGMNLISFLLNKDEPLLISAAYHSGRLNLTEVLENLPNSGSNRRTGVRFPRMVQLNLGFVIDDFIKDRFSASHVRGTATYEPPFLFVDSLTMQTMDGTMTGSFGLAQVRSGTISANVDASLYTIDISRLFQAFNNFGQKQVTHSHLQGTISGRSAFSADFDSVFSIMTGSILSENSVIIRDGELNGFEPIMALSRFIEVEELRNIDFNTLENTILIKDNRVIIPAMDIRSNAINLSASGTHGFDNRYDYRIQLLLSELLYNKAKRSGNSEFTVAEDRSDTRTLFLIISDQGSGTSVEIDREKTARKIRENLKQERNELKRVLNEEFGLFKRDQEVIERKQIQDQEKEILKFDFPQEPDSAVEAPRSQKGKKRWWQRQLRNDTAENKVVKEFVLDESPD